MLKITANKINNSHKKCAKQSQSKWLFLTITLGLIVSAIMISLPIFILLSQNNLNIEFDTPEQIKIDINTIKDTKEKEIRNKYLIIDEECFLDRNRNFHLTCQVIQNPDYKKEQLPLENIDVGYYMYGYDKEEPYSVFSAFSDENGFIDVVVDFEGLAVLIDEEHKMNNVEALYSYDTYAINGIEHSHHRKEHAGEAEFARNNWIQPHSWYEVDYRSYGSRIAASRHSSRSSDTEVVKKFTWVTHPAEGPGANSDGTMNYWGDFNWIIVHDYSWMGKMFLTMCPGMTYYIDGVEYEAKGVFNIDRNNTTDAVFEITGQDPLIIQTCDGWVYVRIIYGYPTGNVL